MDGILEATPKQSSVFSAVLSVTLHATLLLFITSGESFFPSSKPLEIPQTLRVDLVGLPDLKKNEMPVALPSRPEEKDEPEAAPQETTPPPPAAKDEMIVPSKKKEKAVEAPVKPKEIDRKAQMAQTLKRMKTLERLKESEEKSEKSEETATLIKGNKVSPGNSLSGEAKEALEVGYYEKVKDALTENWSLPPWLAKQELSAQVVIQVDAAGQLQGMRFLKSSGNAQFDNSVKATIRQSLPFPHPPKNLIDTVGGKGIVLGFPL